MIGLVIILFIPALISFVVISSYTNKNKAKTLADMILEHTQNNSTRTQILLKEIKDLHKCNLDNSFTPHDASVYVIKPNNNPKIYTVNSNIVSEFPEYKYNELIIKMQNNRILTEYSIDSYSVYYLYDDKKSILLISTSK